MFNSPLVIVPQLSQIYQLYSTCNDASCLTAWWERQCFSHPPSTNSSSGNLANWCSRPIPSWKTRRYYLESCLMFEQKFWRDVHCSVIRVGSDTFGDPIFQKLAILPDYKRPGMLWKIELSKWIFCVKKHLNLSDFFFFLKNNRGTIFVKNDFFGNFNFLTT